MIPALMNGLILAFIVHICTYLGTFIDRLSTQLKPFLVYLLGEYKESALGCKSTLQLSFMQQYVHSKA